MAGGDEKNILETINDFKESFPKSNALKKDIEDFISKIEEYFGTDVGNSDNLLNELEEVKKAKEKLEEEIGKSMENDLTNLVMTLDEILRDTPTLELQTKISLLREALHNWPGDIDFTKENILLQMQRQYVVK